MLALPPWRGGPDAEEPLRTIRGHVTSLKPVVGHLKVADLSTDVVEAMQGAWQGSVTNATINKRCETLRRSLNFALRKRQITAAPWIPRLDAVGQRGRYLRPSDQILLAEHMPGYVMQLVEFARDYGTRRGQLSRTERAWVDLEQGVIVYPPGTCKAREAHVLPLEGAGLALVERLMADGATRPWCRFLFHGPYCSPSRPPNKAYGCVGDFKKAWASACEKAGLPVGRKAGGYTFHNTRNTFATDVRAVAGSIEDVQEIGGWKTAHMVKHYHLGDVAALRERLADSEGRSFSCGSGRRPDPRPLQFPYNGGCV